MPLTQRKIEALERARWILNRNLTSNEIYRLNELLDMKDGRKHSFDAYSAALLLHQEIAG